jgi:hypothetical protein
MGVAGAAVGGVVIGGIGLATAGLVGIIAMSPHLVLDCNP